ncbi:MAG: prolipoprotein diacylglyceryl transferase [Bacillota bacterium]
MIPFPNIDPIAIKIGPYAVPWYGIMYLIGLVVSYLLVKDQLRKKKISNETIDRDMLFVYLVFGLILGGRSIYLTADKFIFYLHHPLDIFAVWSGGMSFHSGLVGVVLALLIFYKKDKYSFLILTDIVAVSAPIGLGLGRIGNFINGELFGRVQRHGGWYFRKVGYYRVILPSYMNFS